MSPRTVRLATPLILLCALAGSALAQSAEKPRRIELSYFGESAKNPGARLGYEAAFYYRQPHELIGAAHLGGYYTPDQGAYSLFIYLEGGYRLNFAVGFFIEARVGLGYVNTTRNSGSQLQTDGTMTLGVDVSGNYLMPIALGGLGWNLLPRTKIPISVFALAGGMGRYNQSEALSGGLVVTAGLAYQFGTQKPRQIELPVPSPPPPVAPPLEGYDLQPGAPPSPPDGPAEQAPSLPPSPAPPPPPPSVNSPLVAPNDRPELPPAPPLPPPPMVPLE